MRRLAETKLGGDGVLPNPGEAERDEFHHWWATDNFKFAPGRDEAIEKQPNVSGGA